MATRRRNLPAWPHGVVATPDGSRCCTWQAGIHAHKTEAAEHDPHCEGEALLDEERRYAKQDALAAASWFFVPRELDRRLWRWFVVRADDTGRHRLAHLHVMRLNEPRWHEQLAFRDALRATPVLAEEYALLKAEAAREHRHDREAYTSAKQAFVQRVLGQNS